MRFATIAVIAGFAAMASAQAANTFGTVSVGDGNSSGNDNNGCHGVLQNEKTCCVGGTLILSICDGWPICNSPPTTTSGVVGCITNIPVSDPNYSALQESILASATGSGSSPKETGADSSAAATQGGASSDSAPSQTKAGSAQETAAPKTTMATSAAAGTKGSAAATSSSALPASSKAGDAGKNAAGLGIAAAAALAVAAL